MATKPSLNKRFIQLLASERQVITYIYLYALFSGLVSLSLPLGIQSLIGFVSGGQVVTSVTVLIFFIVVGVIVVGGLQVMQLSLVEHIQQRIFATKAFEFSTHLTRLQTSQIESHNLPELMNRFFDVISLQKGLAKMLTDFSAAAIQIVFGLLLLSFYHPYFIVFGVLFMVILLVILRVTWPSGMRTSLEESKYKYKLVYWFEEVARALVVFKSASHERLSLQKTDAYTSGYLLARKAHFKVLISQYIGFVGFKTVITASLLLMGSLLLVNQEINLGQFVATEIIIILIINAVEKLLVKLDVVYDVFTSLEKLGAVTDLPLEADEGDYVEEALAGTGVGVQVKHLAYPTGNNARQILKGVNLTVQPAEKVCLTGNDDTSAGMLLQVMAGVYPEFEGVVAYNGLPLKNYSPAVLHEKIGSYLLPDLLFAGTLLENITMGDTDVPIDQVIWALQSVDLADYVQELPKGLHTSVRKHGPAIPEGIAQRLALARSIVRHPRLLLLDTFLPAVSQEQREQIARRILAPDTPWTVIVRSPDPAVMALCHKVALLQNGVITREFTREEATTETDRKQQKDGKTNG